MDHRQKYSKWKQFALNAEIAAELKSIEQDEQEIENRFSSELTFGTAGLRSKLGAGTSRMNVYTVGRATQGLSEYVKKHEGQQSGMVIAYDTRKNSDVFAEATAQVFAANGIKTYLFEQATSVPELSFAIRHLKTFGGVAITASHNPKDYNGYKAYAPWGGQLLGDACEELEQMIESVDDFDKVHSMQMDEAVSKGLIVMLGDDIDAMYFEKLSQMAYSPELIATFARDIHVAYTPLFGTGMRTFAGVIEKMPYDYCVVDSQSAPNEAFPGLDAPNPEDEKAMQKVIALGKKVGADIAFGTDPDADRLGAAIPNEDGEFIMLSGNQIACIITDYLLRCRKEKGLLKPTDYIVKSFVSTRMADDIAKHFGIECITVPTGFKFISDTANNKEKDRFFVFGFEESCGFLAGDFVADKDGVMAGMLLLEVLCECKREGQTLYERLRSLFDKYGWHKEKVVYTMLEGPDGMDRVKSIMHNLRENPPTRLGGQEVIKYTDYQSSVCKEKDCSTSIDFPRANALCFTLKNGWLCIRPSGTEPKLRVYTGVFEKTNAVSEKLLAALEKDARKLLRG